MDSVFLFSLWIIAIVAALSLDVWAYIRGRREWESRGVFITDELSKRVSDRLGQTVQAWQRPAPVKKDPVPLEKPVQKKEVEQPTQAEDTGVESIPASVKTVGGLKRVKFSMEVLLDSTIDISIAATPQAGVKVEKRQVR